MKLGGSTSVCDVASCGVLEEGRGSAGLGELHTELFIHTRKTQDLLGEHL